jgi:hypothetical protein
MDDYYLARNEYYAQKANLIAKRIDGAMYTAQMDPKASEADMILADMLQRVPVDTLEREFKKLKHASEAEVNWKRAADQRTAEVQTAMVSLFGDVKVKEFDHYNTLTGDARKAYGKERPYLSAMSIMTFHADEYQKLVAQFGDEAWAAWSNRPAGERGAYYDANPEAFKVNAWIYGRYEEATGKDLQGLAATATDYYDWGKDYNEAIQKFGDSIWDIVAGYKRGWSKSQKSAYIKANGVITQFWDWWYGNADDGDSYRKGYYRSNYKSYYKRYSRRSYGGRSYGSGYSRSSYGGGGYTPYPPRMPIVDPREMDRNLERNFARDQYRFAPMADTGPYWMQAGENLAPRNATTVEDWRPRRVWK